MSSSFGLLGFQVGGNRLATLTLLFLGEKIFTIHLWTSTNSLQYPVLTVVKTLDRACSLQYFTTYSRKPEYLRIYRNAFRTECKTRTFTCRRHDGGFGPRTATVGFERRRDYCVPVHHRFRTR